MSSKSEDEKVCFPRTLEVDWDRILTHPQLSARMSQPISSETNQLRPVQNLVEPELVPEDAPDLLSNIDPELGNPEKKVDLDQPQEFGDQSSKQGESPDL